MQFVLSQTFVNDYLGGPYGGLALRATCRFARASIAPPKKTTAGQLLIDAVRTGNIENQRVAIQKGAARQLYKEAFVRLIRENRFDLVSKTAKLSFVPPESVVDAVFKSYF